MRIHLPDEQVPTAWFNVAARTPEPPAPPLDPATGRPVPPGAPAGLAPAAMGGTGASQVPWVDIPTPVLEALRLWRPTPLLRARRLERALDTPARIYLKDETGSPTGTHQVNTAVAQAHDARASGAERLVGVSRTGRWGAALAWAAGQFGLGCTVFTPRVELGAAHPGRVLQELWGATGVASPVGDPTAGGTMAEALDDALALVAGDPGARFAAGSWEDHVLLHQTVVGLEARRQLALAGEAGADVVVATVRRGSGLAGLALPFVDDGGVRLVAAEAAGQPHLTGGSFAYQPADAGGRLPLRSGYAAPVAGADRPQPGTGVAPLVSALVRTGRIEAVAYATGHAAAARRELARTEGRLVSSDTGLALQAVRDEAAAAREEGRAPVLLVALTGEGWSDLAAGLI